MKITDMDIGTKLDIELINSLGERIGQTYISQLIEFIDSNNILIAAPIHESRVKLITTGTRIRATFLHPKFSLLSFTGILTGRDKKDNIILFSVRVDSDLESIQRRKYYRLDCTLDVMYRIHQDKEADDSVDENNIEYTRVLTRNISGNGSSIVTDEALPKNTCLEVIINLSSTDSIRVISRVVRSTRIENTKDRKFDTGLYFTEITPKDREILVKYIFDQQRLLLKKNNGVK